MLNGLIKTCKRLIQNYFNVLKTVHVLIPLNLRFGPSSSGSRGWDVGAVCLEPDLPILRLKRTRADFSPDAVWGLFLLFNFSVQISY